jgi:hypothetical protein
MINSYRIYSMVPFLNGDPKLLSAQPLYSRSSLVLVELIEHQPSK